MVFGVIYLITNLLNGMKYVGQTTQKLTVRLKAHRNADSYIGRAIRRYGRENFKIEVLEECETAEQLNEREIFWIAELNCMSPNGYNCTEGGFGGMKGYSHTPKAREKISAALLGNKRSLGYHHTEEARAKIRVAQLGEKHHYFGTHLSEEHKVKLGISRRGESPYKNLLKEMDNRWLSYTALAKLIGIRQASISRKMSGKRKFNENEIAKLVEIFGKPAKYLMARDDE
ncbi:MAG: GIY-YIG nuclease family protein [Selenomonadaceae bacterium]|nr:GIY-YIG nuclease family protein [Selenomonadaceae bacterium]